MSIQYHHYKMMKQTHGVELASDFKRIPELFDRNDFESFINAIDKCPTYPKHHFWKLWMKARDKAILCCLFFTGCRPKEILALKFTDYNYKDNSFFIDGSNNHSRKDRIVPITIEMEKYLSEYLLFPKLSNTYLFPSYDNHSNHVNTNTWKRIFREKVLRPTGRYIKGTDKLMPRTRSYSMRCSYALRLIENGVNPKNVMASMGHSDWRSFMHYLTILSLKGENLNSVREASSFVN